VKQALERVVRVQTLPLPQLTNPACDNCARGILRNGWSGLFGVLLPLGARRRLAAAAAALVALNDFYSFIQGHCSSSRRLSGMFIPEYVKIF
jgi:hypothetical protein